MRLTRALEGADLPSIGPDLAGGVLPPSQFRQAVVSGGRWRLVESFSLQVVSTISTILLVRLLSVDDYTTVAAAVIVTGLFELLAGMGFAAELIQRRKIDQVSLSTNFWAAMGYGACIYTLVALSAPYVAAGLGHESAGRYVVVLALTVPIGMVTAPPRALLIRDFRFRSSALASVAGVMTHGTISVALAATTDLGPWSVIIGKVLQSVTQGAVFFCAARWCPSWAFSWAQVRDRATFNIMFWVTQSAQYIAKNADYWLVARFAGTQTLGLYYVAFTLPNLLRQRINVAVQDVMFPAFANVGNSPQRLASAYTMTTRLLAFVLVPPLLGLAITADQVTNLLFGSRWDAAAEPMAWLAVAAMLNIFPPLVRTVLLAQGRQRWTLQSTLIQVAVLLAGGLALASNDLTAVEMAIAVCVSSLARCIVDSLVAARAIGVSRFVMWRAVQPLVPGLASAAISVLAWRRFVETTDQPALDLAAELMLASGLFFGVSWVVARQALVVNLRNARVLIPGWRPRSMSQS